MLRRYAISLAVVVVFAILLAVVLLTQPKSDTSTPVGGVSPTTSTPNADATKLQIINLPPGDTVNKLVITELAQAGGVLTTTAAATTLSAPSPTVTVTSTPTPFVVVTPGQPRKLNLNHLPLPAPQNVWQVAGQPNFALDSSQVDAAVQQLSNLQGTAALPAEAANNLAQYGLDKPSLSIMLESSKGGSKTLDVGSLNGVTQNYWVKLESDNRVWTLSASTIDAFKAWLNTPPQLPPTPTAAPTTIGASTTISGTAGASPTISGTTVGVGSTLGGSATPASTAAITTLAGTVNPGPATTGTVTGPTSVSGTITSGATTTPGVATTVTNTVTTAPITATDTSTATATSK